MNPQGIVRQIVILRKPIESEKFFLKKKIDLLIRLLQSLFKKCTENI
jgi:hypothetical protein